LISFIITYRHCFCYQI